MKWLNALAALGVLASAVAADWFLVLPRYRCQKIKTVVNATTIRITGDKPGPDPIGTAQRQVNLCRQCLESYPNDYEFYLLLGSNLEVLGSHEAAEVAYRRSLALNARPETYAALALLLLEEGRVEEARRSLYAGALFNAGIVQVVSDPLRTEVLEAVMARHRRLGMPDVRRHKQ